MKNLSKYDKALYYEIFRKGEYSLLDGFIKDAGTVFDVGGYIGFFSQYCLSLNDDLRIHYFEPLRKFYLKAQDWLNYEERMCFNNKGLRTVNCQKDLFINDNKPMQTSLFNGHFLNKSGESCIGEFLDIQNYIAENGINSVDLCKVDIEGAEIPLFESMNEDVFKKIKVLFFEYHLLFDGFEKRLRNIIAKLQKIYKTVEIKENKYSDDLGYVLCY